MLITAVDRFAEARRTASQTSDDAKNVARAELRAELHSGSVLATVVSPYSGDTFAIRPQYWARDIALTWFEQGECLLTEDFVDPNSPELAGPGRFPSLWKGENATIFVSEHDFQRLLVRQVIKQKSGPNVPIDHAEARKKNKGGRPPDYDWGQIKDFTLSLVKKHGKPGKDNRRLPTVEQLIDAVLDEWALKGIDLARSTVRRYVVKWLS